MAADDLQDRIKRLSNGLPQQVAPLGVLSADMMHLDNKPIPNLSDPLWREAIYLYMQDHQDMRVIILDNRNACQMSTCQLPL